MQLATVFWDAGHGNHHTFQKETEPAQLATQAKKRPKFGWLITKGSTDKWYIVYLKNDKICLKSCVLSLSEVFFIHKNKIKTALKSPHSSESSLPWLSALLCLILWPSNILVYQLACMVQRFRIFFYFHSFIVMSATGRRAQKQEYQINRGFNENSRQLNSGRNVGRNSL